MYGVELYAAVRLAVVDEGLSHHEAGRRFGIDRRTVKKMLSYAAPPGYRRPKPVRRPKLDGFTGIVDAIQQRVALARALVMRPQVLLLDEPLAALDLKLRQAMQEELRRIHNSIGGTFVFVTHDQGEALGLANIVAVMDEGVLAQLGSPEEIYSAPKTQFVSTFIGEANVFAGTRVGGEVRLDLGARFAAAGGDGPVRVVVRPEAVALAREQLDAEVVLSGELRDMVFLGPYVRYKVMLGDGAEVIVNNADLSLRQGLELGIKVSVGWTLAAHRVIDAG